MSNPFEQTTCDELKSEKGRLGQSKHDKSPQPIDFTQAVQEAYARKAMYQRCPGFEAELRQQQETLTRIDPKANHAPHRAKEIQDRRELMQRHLERVALQG